MIRRPPRSTPLYSSAASDVYKRQGLSTCQHLGFWQAEGVSNTSSASVVLEGVSVKYEDRTVLGPIDLEIRSDERWIVLGPNGSGKTSLVKILSLYRYPTTGSVQILGERWGQTDVRELRKRIGLASSSLRDQFRADITGLEIVVTARHAALETWWHTSVSYTHLRAHET